MRNRINALLKNKQGMSLVELLTAFSILTLMIFCFAPLMLSYFTNVDLSGQKMERVYNESSKMQVLLGGAVSQDKYSVTLDDIPIQLTAPDAMVTIDGTTKKVSSATVSSNVAAYGLSTINKDEANMNLNNGYITAYTDELGSSSGIKLFPSSLTDDFKTAYITIYGNGINFILGECTFVTTGTTGEIALTEGVDYELEYHPDAKPGDKNMLLLTVYGGGDKISFETSPLVFKHAGQRYEIQIDAPMMIMVGEKSLKADDEGNQYHYYVSRGEIDDEGNLLIHRRVMRTTSDPKDSSVTGSNPTVLNSAMNDVEWVPEESADNYSKDSSGDTYGYYVMCGDNGQVRRFWKRPDTTITADGKTVPVDGNYYWGGDYTYYTDYDFVQVNDSNPAHINSMDKTGKNAYAGRVYSTDTYFKFISQRDATNNQSGFNVSSKEYSLVGSLVNLNTALLRSLTVVSVTNADDGEFYGADGQIRFYKLKGGSTSIYPTITEANSKPSKWQGKTVDQWVNTVNDTAHGWLNMNGNSYFDFMGVNPTNKVSYPITLTSVDAIRIITPNKTDVKNDGSYYFTASGDGDTISENATTNMNYPQESYTLYCGYIPAMMDLFASKTGSTGSYKWPVEWNGSYGHSNDGTFYEVPTATGLTRAGNRTTLKDNASLVGYWRMTLGVTPYYTSGTSLNIDTTKQGNLAYYRNYTSWFTKYYDYVVHYPYTNLGYAITGKFYDAETYNTKLDFIKSYFKNFESTGYTIATPDVLINHHDGVQQNVTNGDVVDITISYLSHPFAISVSANPTDDIVYDLSNNKSDSAYVFYWNNRRETITFLDSASTTVPSGENDIPVSLMVGYVLGGTVRYSDSGNDTTVDVGSVMNNGIVFLRAGDYRVEKQNSANGQTYEYLAIDKDGYKLSTESNVFHQFYYLNSRARLENKEGGSGAHTEYAYEPTKKENIGNLYGADYWQNNRHILYKSIAGGVASEGNDGSYEYLRAHPMSNTKVNCVAWGTTWNGYPEAMWGTDNGTVLSWWVNTTTTQNSSHNSYDWNDRSVDAEFQSYQWVDRVNGKTFSVQTDGNADSVGSAAWGSKNSNATTYTLSSGIVPDSFKYFTDKTSQATGLWGTIGFISTLESVNDIEFANDMWVAAGDQSGKNPADYCSHGTWNGGGETAKAFSGTGRGGSWINVRYWVDTNGSGKHTDGNAYYHWRAVQISKNQNYNIVQINYVNGMWIATGYVDGTNGGMLNDEYDEGEKTVICWTYDPLLSCDDEGGWSEKVVMYDGAQRKDMNEMGGINSVATRT